MKTVFQALEALRSANIKVKPFINYDAANQVETVDNGVTFKSDEDQWVIGKVEYSGQGNLNLKFYIDGTMTEPDGTEHRCKEVRSISVVKNGELKLQFLMIDRKATECPVPVKNHIVDLSQYDLTDATDVDVDEVFRQNVMKFAQSLFYSRPVRVLSAEQARLSALGLSPDGFFNKPVAKQTEVEANDKVTLKIAGCSNKTTKTAKALKIALSDRVIPESNLNKLLYDMKCLKKTGSFNCRAVITGIHDPIVLDGVVQV